MEGNKVREKQLFEYITTTHMLCLIIILATFLISNNIVTGCSYYPILNLRFVFFLSLGAIVAIVHYNLRNSLTLKNIYSKIDLIYVSFPLIISVITLFIIRGSVDYIELIFLIPVLITASTMGKKPGLVMATISVFTISSYLLLFSNTSSINIIESRLILFSMLYLVGFFIGGLTDVETQYRKYLTEVAHTDMLTGLYNHRFFHDKLRETLTFSKNPTSMIMIDIDYFKHYNDSYGHQAGDTVLEQFGCILNDAVKEIGFAARYGGEEFVVVLPNCDCNKALEVAETIRKKISDQTFDGEEHQPGGKITVSCGIATCPTQADNAKDLIKYADMALYRAKSLNKNKVELYFSVFDELDVNENEKELVNSIRMLVSVINAKDRYTYGHSERVTEYSLQLAESIGLAEAEKRLLNYAAFLHDIGKIEIDREILNSSRRLTDEEFEILKQHPSWGSDIVKAVGKLQPAAEIILYHHENYDGSGYPNKLRGEEIPLLARIIRIVDSYDAMTSNRPYKRNMSAVEALEELERCSGSMYDPELTKKFIGIISAEQKLRIKNNYQ